MGGESEIGMLPLRRGKVNGKRVQSGCKSHAGKSVSVAAACLGGRL